MIKQKGLLLSVMAATIISPINAETIVDTQKSKNTIVKNVNGVTQIDIDAPNKNGVSINNFKKFEVVGKGSIINNSSTDYDSVLAGRIKGNKNLSQREADVAVMKATGAHSTKLTSALEAASSRDLHVYIANENGILVDGGSFINIKKLTLGTGDVDENLVTKVQKGEVVISEKGLNGIQNLNIFTTALKNQGKIGAGEKITAVLGKNTIDKNGKVIFTPSKVVVSSSNLGKMYSDQIEIKTSSNLVDLDIDEMLAKSKIDVQTKGKVTNKGSMLAKDKINIKANSFDNIGKVDFGENSYDLKWITRDGKVVDVDFIKKVWNKTHKHQLTSKDTWLLMTGSLLNQWTYDEGTYEKEGSIVNNFTKFIENINSTDANAVLTKDGKNAVLSKQRDSDFVNKGDIYATETDDKRILSAIAISKAKAKQAKVAAKDIVIRLDDVLTNKDALIDAKGNLAIKAKKIINKNSTSGEILLQDGYENISWEVMPIYVEKKGLFKTVKVIADATYDLEYKRGLVDKKSARKTKITAVNKSLIKGKNVNITADELNLEDEVNTGVGLKGEDVNIKSGKLSLKGQALQADKLSIDTKEAVLTSGLIKSKKANIKAENIKLNAKKTKEIVLKTDKEELTRQSASGSGIVVDGELDIDAMNVKLSSSIIKANDLKIKADKIDNESLALQKDYKSSYEISKTFRKIKHNEKTEQNSASFIYAKNLNIDAKQLNSKGSHVVGTEHIDINSKITNIDVSKVKRELDKKVGIDNGILGLNYKKTKKEEQKAIGSVVQSDGDIDAKVQKELNVIGSKIKGKKVNLEAENVNISSSTNQGESTDDSRFLLAGEELTGSVELGDLGVKIDMQIGKKEHINKKEVTNNSSSIQGEEVNVVAKKDIKVEGSNIKGENVKLKGENVQITDAKDKLDVKKDSLTQNISAEFGLDGEDASASVDYELEHKNEKLKEEGSHASNIEGGKVEISANDVKVEGSNIKAKDVIVEAKNKVTIQNAQNSSKYEQNSEKLLLGVGGGVNSPVIGLVTTAKKLVDEREELLGYVLNPVAGAEKVKEIKELLEANYEHIKNLVEVAKSNDIDPESIGIAVTVNGKINLDKKYINILEKKISSSNITGENVHISSSQVDIQGSNVVAKNVNIDAEHINITADQNKKDGYEIAANVGVDGEYDIITETGSIGINAGVNHKQNHKKEQVGSNIEAGKVTISSKGDINVENSKITSSDEGSSVSASGDINLVSKADSETNVAIGVNGSLDPKELEGEATINAKVEHNQEVVSSADIDVANVNGNINKKDGVNTNINAGGSITTDGHGADGEIAVETTIKKGTEHTDGEYTLGINGKLGVDEEGEVESGVGTDIAANIDILTDEKLPLKDTNIKLENHTSIDGEGVISSDSATDITTTIAGSKDMVEGSLTISGHGEAGVNSEEGLTDLQGDLDSDGTMTVAGKKDHIDGSLTINSQTNVHAELEEEVSASANVNAQSSVTVADAVTVSSQASVEAATNEEVSTNTSSEIKLEQTTTEKIKSWFSKIADSFKKRREARRWASR